MHRSIFILTGTGIVAAIAVGILVVSYDPYQASFSVKALFFGGLGIIGISLIGLIYCSLRLLFKSFNKSRHGN